MPAAADANALGRYLRVRRALVRPDAAGVPGQGNRRVPGLRRAEIAFLARVSPRSTRNRRAEKVSDSIRPRIGSWPLTPAYVHGKYMHILAANTLATALCH